MTEQVRLQQDAIYRPSIRIGTAVFSLGAWQATQRMLGVAVCGRIMPTIQFVEGSCPRWFSLRSPELCLVLHIPVLLAGPGQKDHKAWPEQSQHVFSTFGLWLAGLGSSVLAIDYSGRGASDDGCKTLCLERRI